MTDYLDLRDVYDDATSDEAGPDRDEARAIIASFIADGLAHDMDSFREYAENEPTAVPEHAWLNYVQDCAEDIGAIDRNLSWPHNCIDWERAARELRHDYSVFDHAGTSYYVRSY